jgi:hypothetical protein
MILLKTKLDDKQYEEFHSEELKIIDLLKEKLCEYHFETKKTLESLTVRPFLRSAAVDDLVKRMNVLIPAEGLDPILFPSDDRVHGWISKTYSLDGCSLFNSPCKERKRMRRSVGSSWMWNPSPLSVR